MAKPDSASFYTQAELARLAGVVRSAVSAAIRRGQIKTVPTIGGTPIISRSEAQRWMRERREPGRPTGTVKSDGQVGASKPKGVRRRKKA